MRVKQLNIPTNVTSSGAAAASSLEELPPIVVERKHRWWTEHVTRDLWPLDRELLNHYLDHACNEDGCSCWGTHRLAIHFGVARQTLLDARQRLIGAGMIRLLSPAEKIAKGLMSWLAVVQVVDWDWIDEDAQHDEPCAPKFVNEAQTHTPTLARTCTRQAAVDKQPLPPQTAAIQVHRDDAAAALGTSLSLEAERLIAIGIPRRLVICASVERIADVAAHIRYRYPNDPAGQGRLGRWLLCAPEGGKGDPERQVPQRKKRAGTATPLVARQPVRPTPENEREQMAGARLCLAALHAAKGRLPSRQDSQ